MLYTVAHGCQLNDSYTNIIYTFFLLFFFILLCFISFLFSSLGFTFYLLTCLLITMYACVNLKKSPVKIFFMHLYTNDVF